MQGLTPSQIDCAQHLLEIGIDPLIAHRAAIASRSPSRTLATWTPRSNPHARPPARRNTTAISNERAIGHSMEPENKVSETATTTTTTSTCRL